MNFKTLAHMTIIPMVIFGCNDSSSTASATDPQAAIVEELGKCTISREGKVEFYEPDFSYYKCHKGNWLLTEDPEEKQSSSSTLQNDSSNDNQNSSSENSEGSSNSYNQVESNNSNQTESSNDNQSTSSDDQTESSDDNQSTSSGSEQVESSNSSLSKLEQALGLCQSSNIGEAKLYYNGIRNWPCQCTVEGWQGITALEYDKASLKCSSEGSILHSDYTDFYYVCRNSKLTYPTLNHLSLTYNYTANLWNGLSDATVNTGFDNVGYWFAYGDYSDGGMAQIYRSNNAVITAYYDEDGPLFTADKGLKNSYLLVNNEENGSYIGVGFNLDSDGNQPKKVDITNWKGLCLVYASTTPFYIMIGTEATERVEGEIRALIPASLKLTTIDLPWSKFSQPEWVNGIENISVSLTKAINVTMRWMISNYENDSAPQGAFFIGAIGKQGACKLN